MISDDVTVNYTDLYVYLNAHFSDKGEIHPCINSPVQSKAKTVGQMCEFCF